jgi:hypothetical protein
MDGYISFESIPAHSISVFFVILATGLIFSTGQSAPILREQYHALASAAFSLDSITRGASTSSVQAMLLMIHYSYWTDRNGAEWRWLYNGLCVRIAVMVGSLAWYDLKYNVTISIDWLTCVCMQFKYCGSDALILQSGIVLGGILRKKR